jgi:hypothetical protein
MLPCAAYDTPASAATDEIKTQLRRMFWRSQTSRLATSLIYEAMSWQLAHMYESAEKAGIRKWSKAECVKDEKTSTRSSANIVQP